MFQLLTEERGPWKLAWFRAQGTPGLPGPELLVQSQRRQRFLTTIVDIDTGLLFRRRLYSCTYGRKYCAVCDFESVSRKIEVGCEEMDVVLIAE